MLDLPPLREIIARYDLWADKRLGQNFLLDGNITDKIARGAGDLSQTHIIEIGPGPGGLTRSLLRADALSVTALEFDPRAVNALQELAIASGGRLRVVRGDALETDLCTLVPAPRAIVANLPYNIATPLLVGWLRQLREHSGCYQSMTLMFQREVADRMTARPGGKIYGRLSVLVQWLTRAQRLFDIPGSAFVPPPKVTSSVVRFDPLALSGPQPAFEAVEALTAAAFGQRRKMLRSSLAPWRQAMDALGIDETLRAEQLTVEQFMVLASAGTTSS